MTTETSLLDPLYGLQAWCFVWSVMQSWTGGPELYAAQVLNVAQPTPSLYPLEVKASQPSIRPMQNLASQRSKIKGHLPEETGLPTYASVSKICVCDHFTPPPTPLMKMLPSTAFRLTYKTFLKHLILLCA